jgi:SOS-response transcriptional repressor LexA
MTASGAFSWNSELPSGRNPFWIRDDGLVGLGLHVGDAVSVDTGAEPRDGDLVVAEVDIDGDSQRLARRYFSEGDKVRLEAVGEGLDRLELPAESVMVMPACASRQHPRRRLKSRSIADSVQHSALSTDYWAPGARALLQ